MIARTTRPQGRWARHARAFRDPAEVAGQWTPPALPPELLAYRATAGWWDALARTRGTLIVTREYEHLVIALTVVDGRPRVTFLPLPHPNGVAVSPGGTLLYIASTRNPNMVYELAGQTSQRGLVLLPARCWYYPGALYLHDLAFVGTHLYAAAPGLNSVVRLASEGGYELAWWPRSVERRGRPRTDRNYLQLNSIAGGPSLDASYFTASVAQPGTRRPGQLNFAVDRRGVLFSGRRREPVAGGLTRPHSARFHRDAVWVANSGYGEVGPIVAGRFEAAAGLPGWTRGVCFGGPLLFAGTSRVLPRFSRYAPGLSTKTSRAGVHAIDAKSGRVLGSVFWPAGDQLFGLELMPGHVELPFPRRNDAAVRSLFYDAG